MHFSVRRTRSFPKKKTETRKLCEKKNPREIKSKIFIFLEIVEIWGMDSEWVLVYIYFPASDEFIVARNGVFRHLIFELEKKSSKNNNF